ncbi:hypothetical protein [Microbacterium sp.]|uniref:hypothetical protein n=1 Tax=Microbacterium sp. TaxID=51671 RepID=UPI003C727D89
MTAMSASAAIGAPVERLLEARRGTAYFSRILNDTADDRLEREHNAAESVARVALQARAMAEFLEAVRTATSYRPRASLHDEEAVRFTATLSPTALRNLHAHAVVHLNVEWRDLPAALWSIGAGGWSEDLRTPETLVDERRAQVWLSALALDPLGRTAALPRDLLE